MGKCGSPERQRPDIQQNYLKENMMTDEEQYAKALAKLAVAVGALEDALNRMEEDRASGDCGNWDWVDGDVYSRGRAALAEIKGERDAD
jgi:hypothetical protein